MRTNFQPIATPQHRSNKMASPRFNGMFTQIWKKALFPDEYYQEIQLSDRIVPPRLKTLEGHVDELVDLIKQHYPEYRDNLQVYKHLSSVPPGFRLGSMSIIEPGYYIHSNTGTSRGLWLAVGLPQGTQSRTVSINSNLAKPDLPSTPKPLREKMQQIIEEVCNLSSPMPKQA